MDSLPIITGIITSVLGAGAIAFGMTSWLLKRFIASFEQKQSLHEKKLDRIIEKLDDLRDKLHSDYLTKSEFEMRFVTLKEDLQREIELVFRVLQAQVPRDDNAS